MKRSLALTAAALLVSPVAAAQTGVPERPEIQESTEKPPARVRSSLLIGGLGLTTGVWALNLGSSYMFPDEPGFSSLRVPVAGPWLGLANNKCNGSCEFVNYFNYVYFTVSGLAQAGGLGLVLEALLLPTAPPTAPGAPRVLPAPRPAPADPDAPPAPAPPGDRPPPTSPSKPLFYLPMPSPIGQGGVGFTLGGLF